MHTVPCKGWNLKCEFIWSTLKYAICQQEETLKEHKTEKKIQYKRLKECQAALIRVILKNLVKDRQ